jgi:hypothetical protein
MAGMNKVAQPKQKSRRLVLACNVMETEIRSLKDDLVDVRFLDYGLHNVPEKMSEAIQNEIDCAIETGDYEAIILGYGLCSNGIVGVKARHIPLVVPRVHDCISLFLGSVKKYRTEVAACPGTFYLTPGWIEKGDTPISKYTSYCRNYNEETAKWILHEEMKNYTRILFIHTNSGNLKGHYREIAHKNAAFLNVSCQELHGSSKFFRRLVHGPWNAARFLILQDGDSVQQGVCEDV